MKLLEHILTWTLEELKTPSAGTPELQWGSEPVRLAPTLILAAKLPLDQAPEPKAAPAPPPGFVCRVSSSHPPQNNKILYRFPSYQRW